MRPVFLCGPGRSGTTVLRRALGTLPDVATMPGELRIVCDPDGILDLHDALTDGWDPYRGDVALERFKVLMENVGPKPYPYGATALRVWVGEDVWDEALDELFKRIAADQVITPWTGTERGWMWETVPRPEVGSTLDAFVRRLYRARSIGATHWVDDTPYSGHHVGRIRRIWPAARFVFCVRHPLDILASWLHGPHRWTPKEPATAACRILASMSHTLSRVRVHDAVCRVLRLEDVLEGPEDHLGRLTVFLGVGGSYDIAHMAEVYDPGQANVRRRAKLTDYERQVGLDILGPVSRSLGYGE